MPSVLEREFHYYLDHQHELVKTFTGRYLLIRDERVIGDYDSQIDAVRAGAERFPFGTFLVQKCEPGTESYTHEFHSVFVPRN